MLKIAITGNMGSGKSTICKVFEILGVPVFYADYHAKIFLNKKTCKQQIREKFGKEVFDKKDQIDKKSLAKLIFHDKKKLQQLNAIIHPLVFNKFEHWVNQHKEKPYCIQEAALIFETGNYKRFDQVILVYAPEETLIQRITIRDQISNHDAQARLANQMDQEEKRKMADYVIYNDNTKLLIPQLLELHQYFLSQSKNMS